MGDKEESMRILHILVLGGAMACPPVALADLPFDAGKLGHMKGILDVCSKATPRGASDYLLQMKAMIGAATKAMVDEAAKTEEYQQAYQSIRSEFSNMAQDEVVAACTSYLTTKN
jgi:hypothetical protein